MATPAGSPRRGQRRGRLLVPAAAGLLGVALVAFLLVSGGPSRADSAAERSDRRNPAVPARLLFASRPDDGLAEFPQQIHPERISVVRDPAGDGGGRENVLEFNVRNSDTGPTENPRAQLETPSDFEEGDDRYMGVSYYFPREFPSELPEQGWVTVSSMAYGAPYEGAGPVGIRVQNHVGGGGAELRWQRNDTYDDDIPWVGPRIADVRGRWVGLVVRIKLHRDPAIGFVELWMDTGSGWKQQKLAGEARLYMTTYDTSNDEGPNNARLTLYYRQDIPGPLRMYQGGLRIASAGRGAFLAVAPPQSSAAGD